MKKLRIKQHKEKHHYETVIGEFAKCWPTKGYMPIAIGYGKTQEEADTKALEKFNKLK